MSVYARFIFNDLNSLDLKGEEFPSEGTATIFGKDIRLHPKAARQHVIFVPLYLPMLTHSGNDL